MGNTTKLEMSNMRQAVLCPRFVYLWVVRVRAPTDVDRRWKAVEPKAETKHTAEEQLPQPVRKRKAEAMGQVDASDGATIASEFAESVFDLEAFSSDADAGSSLNPIDLDGD